MIGKTISHYEILEKLGEGGMGIVYKAHDTKLDRTVALKFLPQHVGTDDTEKQRFLNEAKAASALDHSNICAIHSIDETDDGNLFIVMAYYDGMSLKEKIEQGPLPLKDVVNYSLQIASGLQKAHEKGVVHRDLKPANIFITNDNQIKIIDFGLARVAERTLLTKSGATLGTVPYMSPEQAQGQKVDNRTDIWSLGVVMYEMITGQRPFKSEYETALVYSIINEDPEPVTGLRSGVPMEMEKIIGKCLAKDPQERYQHIDEIIVDLRRVQKEITSGVRTQVTTSPVGEGTQTQSEGIKSSTTVRLSRKSLKPFLYSVLIILILSIALYFYLYERTSPRELDRSIAVLPLENLSPNPGDEYFADGVHEDIIVQLSGIGDLRVIARSSVLPYRTERRNLRQIANDLNVSTILEGSVRREGDIVRVSVQLVDPYNNRSLWANAYERSMTGIFEIQQSIATEIASALKAKLTPEERNRLVEHPTEVIEAYEYYLRARDYFLRVGYMEENYRAAKNLLYHSIEQDPRFVHAYALLSQVYSALVWFGYDNSPQAIELSKRNAERALQLHSEMAESHIALGYYYYWAIRDYAKAIEHFYTALQYQPNNAEIYGAISFVERRLGKFENALENLKKASLLDPMNNSYQHIQAEVFWVLRKYRDAHGVLEKLLSLSPDDHYAQMLYLLVSISSGVGPEVMTRTMREHPQLKQIYSYHFLDAQFRLRDFEGMINSVDEISEDLYKTWIAIRPSSYYLGLAYDYLNDRDRARHYYEVALSVMKELPADLHDDPRYRMGLGMIYAGLGLQEQAIEEGSKAADSMPISFDAYWGPMYQEDFAYIYARLNKSKEAVEILRKLLTIPSYVSIPKLKIDPSWDSIRDTPEFQGLLREFEERMS